ncbi:MAG: VWA domain-containing protein [Bacteroidetes bacterium]|nr:VWA domain-containing protein [Bacteroidota bacterium]
MFRFWNFEFYNPWLLLAFLLLIPIIVKDYKKKKTIGISIPSTENMTEDHGFVGVLFFLKFSKYLVLSSIILALARPRSYNISSDYDDTKGIDIILAVDVSLSMLAKDLEPDRLTALKNIAKRFVDQRQSDRIGLVTYSGEAFPKVPLTTDHQVVIDELENLNPFELNPGTAIGEGLAVAVNHLKKAKSKSKIIILMTDGENNIENAIPPQVAAELAKSNGIKVYTIGIGTNGYALFPTRTDAFGDIIFTEQEVRINEPSLKEIAETTGGKYYRATSNKSLENIYEQINQLEKSDVKNNKLYNYKDYFQYLLFFAFFIVILDGLLRWVFYKSIV